MAQCDREEIASEETAEPVTILMDKGKSLRVIAETPGLTEEKILIDPGNMNWRSLQPKPDPKKKFRKVIIMPIRKMLEKKRFRRGILDLPLEKIVLI